MSAARPPEPLPAPAFDSHCHLEMIDRPTPDVVAEAAAAGITRMITIGTDLESSRWASVPVRQGSPLTRPEPLFAKLDPSVIDEELARLEKS